MAFSDPIIEIRSINNCNIRHFVWENDGKPTVLFIHATGFHARCWDATIRELGGEYQSIALDMRGHGGSQKQPPYAWRTFGHDVAHFVEALDLKDLIAVGHSMGGHSLVQACAKNPYRYRGLVLVDPVIVDPSHYDTRETHSEEDAVDQHPVARRRNVWDSPDEMYQKFRNRHPFALWQDAVLRDYCDWGLKATENGKYVLACPPHVEATIYTGSRRHDVSDLCLKIAHPVVVMRAPGRPLELDALDFTNSPTRPDLFRQFRNGVDCFLPDLTHFIPMQRPDLVARAIHQLDSMS